MDILYSVLPVPDSLIEVVPSHLFSEPSTSNIIQYIVYVSVGRQQSQTRGTKFQHIVVSVQ